METREDESLGRPAGINILLTFCSGATCCHSSSSSLSSLPPPLLLQPSSFISIPPTAFCLLITVSFHAIAGSPHSPLPPFMRPPMPSSTSSTSCLFAYVATSVFTLAARRRNLPLNCFHHEYFMISWLISHCRHVVLSSAAAACQGPSPIPSALIQSNQDSSPSPPSPTTAFTQDSPDKRSHSAAFPRHVSTAFCRRKGRGEQVAIWALCIYREIDQ